jgi:hypothetical protein
VIVIVFSFDPLRRFLEEKTDQLLFGERGRAGQRRRDGLARKEGALEVGSPWPFSSPGFGRSCLTVSSKPFF